MIRVVFDPTTLQEPLRREWQEWMARAEASTQQAIEAWEEWRSNGSLGEFKCPLEQKVWADLKNWLITNVFHDKCAYCETREVRSPYHAEHFRPKGSVKYRREGERKTQRAFTKDEDGNEIEHPGYFWLAYNWTNLLPSCNDCNTALGKKDQFPVKKSHVGVSRLSAVEIAQLQRREIESWKRQAVYYLQPEDLNILEDPLLLNPYLDDPSDHLVFGDRGIVAPREGSEKGRASVAVYNLDAERLRVARQEAQEKANKDYSLEFVRGENKPLSQRTLEAKQSISGYIGGENPYSAAVLDYLRLVHPMHGI